MTFVSGIAQFLRNLHAAFEDLMRVYYVDPLFNMIDIDHPGPIWRAIGTPVMDFLNRHVIAMSTIMVTIQCVGLWRIYANEREMARQCHIIQRIMDKPSGAEREEVILDICVEITEWYDAKRGLERWRADYLMEIPGAKKHWERKHPGRVRKKFCWAKDEKPMDKFDLRIFKMKHTE